MHFKDRPPLVRMKLKLPCVPARHLAQTRLVIKPCAFHFFRVYNSNRYNLQASALTAHMPALRACSGAVQREKRVCESRPRAAAAAELFRREERRFEG